MTDSAGSILSSASRTPAHLPKALVPGISIRLVDGADAAPLAEAYARNRRFLAPWEPERADTFFTPGRQLDIIRSKRAQYELGTEVPWVLLAGDAGVMGDGGTGIIGTITLTGIVRGPSLSANLGYWVDQNFTGRGIATAAVLFVASHARRELGLQPGPPPKWE